MGVATQSIVMNGKNYVLAGPTRLDELLQQLSLNGKKLAVERNHEIVPKSQFAVTEIQNGDILEIIVAVGGG
jgi:sulfur carrier protein